MEFYCDSFYPAHPALRVQVVLTKLIKYINVVLEMFAYDSSHLVIMISPIDISGLIFSGVGNGMNGWDRLREAGKKTVRGKRDKIGHIVVKLAEWRPAHDSKARAGGDEVNERTRGRKESKITGKGRKGQSESKGKWGRWLFEFWQR